MSACIDPECAGCREARCANWAQCHGERAVIVDRGRERYGGRYCGLCRMYKSRHGAYPDARHFAPRAACGAVDCQAPVKALGYCTRHYYAAWRARRGPRRAG